MGYKRIGKYGDALKKCHELDRVSVLLLVLILTVRMRGLFARDGYSIDPTDRRSDAVEMMSS